MALNLEQEGNPIARIVSKTKNKRTPKIIYVTDDENNVENGYKMIQCREGETIQHIPNFNQERDILYIVGQSGSGKSYYMKQYCRQYNVLYPERQIYILSTVSNDVSLDNIKNVNYLDINSDEFLQTDLTSEDFKDSLVCFDDTDCIRDRLLKRKIDSILTMLLQIGRHNNISVIFISHVACNGVDTKVILNEAHYITFFPKGCGGRSLKYLLENYLNLDKKQIEQIKKIKSRHITISKNYPIAVMYNTGVYILD